MLRKVVKWEELWFHFFAACLMLFHTEGAAQG